MEFAAPAVFGIVAAVALIPAVLAVTVKNVFHAALCLVLSLTGVAGLFGLLDAQFLFAAQILVYVGAVTVLLLFVVLLSGSPRDWTIRQVNRQWAAGLAAAAVLASLLAVVFRQLPEGSTETPWSGAVPLGVLLVRDMLLPFEVVSLVLLAALVGAIHFTRGKGPS